ncbi:hypothetical protein A8C32_12170 [Flavivirga aquatica]|uniref:Uncharacterized protein n=1 Tax=Flavivirga aquatica TaxID=1849968 RepID=A0A1E5TDL6_9FLAO|nr:hypothetical protein [Flavivirga aquatica]OEK09465.1 hypothetical protein A8C32_12170 [Flavivirga aquatica]
MSAKILSVFCLLVLSFSCKKAQENVIEENKSESVAEHDFSKFKYIDYALDEKTEKALEDWQEYFQLQDIITNVKKGDLSFFEDNKVEVKLFLKKLKESIPEKVNASSIFARILVLETKFYKLESLYNLSTTNNEELSSAVKEFLVSFSNLNLQMNKKIEFDNRTISKPE